MNRRGDGDGRAGVLVVSCDKYQDLWPHFLDLFFRSWRDCPFRVYLGSNRTPVQHERVTAITIGDDRSWTENLKAMLAVMPEECVILFLDDFFLLAPPRMEGVSAALDAVCTGGLDSVRLVRTPRPPSVPLRGHPGLGLFLPGTPYRVTTQVTVWRRAFLEALCCFPLSAWDFEQTLSKVCSFVPCRLAGVYESVVEYRHAVEKGRWLPQGTDILLSRGLTPDYGRRPPMTHEQLAQYFGLREALAYRCFKASPEWFQRRVHTWVWRRQVADQVPVLREALGRAGPAPRGR